MLTFTRNSIDVTATPPPCRERLLLVGGDEVNGGIRAWQEGWSVRSAEGPYSRALASARSVLPVLHCSDAATRQARPRAVRTAAVAPRSSVRAAAGACRW